MKTLPDLRAYCLAKHAAAEDFPFGEETLVFKVMGKMFGLCGMNEQPLRVNLKCEPDYAEALRATYPAVTPGYYMNKRHWNTVIFDGSLPDELLRELIDLSYSLVVKGLKKAAREALLNPESV